MIIHVKFDDSTTTYFDWTKTDEKEIMKFIDPRAVPHFNVFNVKFGEIDKTLIEEHYMMSYFKCDKSSTGWCAMFVSKIR